MAEAEREKRAAKPEEPQDSHDERGPCLLGAGFFGSFEGSSPEPWMVRAINILYLSRIKIHYSLSFSIIRIYENKLSSEPFLNLFIAF